MYTLETLIQVRQHVYLTKDFPFSTLSIDKVRERSIYFIGFMSAEIISLKKFNVPNIYVKFVRIRFYSGKQSKILTF